MDPNACLERMIDAAVDGDFDAFNEAEEDLEEWLSKGGFPPDWAKWNLEGIKWEYRIAILELSKRWPNGKGD